MKQCYSDFLYYSEFFSGLFDTSGSMVPRLVPEILSKCAFCDEVAVAVAVAGIGDSRSLMKITCRLLFLILVINGSAQQQNRITSFTDVISNMFCDTHMSTEEKTGIKTLEQVHTYAKLKSDPHASLPDSFTVCSTLLTESCKSYAWTLFFTILDNQGAQLMAAWLTHGSEERKYGIDFAEGSAQRVISEIPPLFSNEWTRSCMAINTTSGLIHWVAEGILVLDIQSEEIRISPQ